MDISRDSGLLDLMKQSGCIGIFFGIESFGDESLQDAHKPQNKSQNYREQIQALHDRGICVMAGFIAGFDSDTPDSVRAMAKQLYDVGVDVPFLSILTPFRGTSDYQKLEDEGRILTQRGLEFYNGYNVTFKPKQMTPAELVSAHRALWRETFSLKYSLLRVLRGFRKLRFGAALMCAFMNLFYCLKNLRGNTPVQFEAANSPWRSELEQAVEKPSQSESPQLVEIGK